MTSGRKAVWRTRPSNGVGTGNSKIAGELETLWKGTEETMQSNLTT